MCNVIYNTSDDVIAGREPSYLTLITVLAVLQVERVTSRCVVLQLKCLLSLGVCCVCGTPVSLVSARGEGGRLSSRENIRLDPLRWEQRTRISPEILTK